MPKKQHGRPAKSKARSRRPAAARTAVEPSGGLGDTQPSAGVMTAPPPQASLSRPGVVTTSVSRSPRSAARVPLLSVDYRYLRRDLTYLSVLAPLMVVILIIAFFVFH